MEFPQKKNGLDQDRKHFVEPFVLALLRPLGRSPMGVHRAKGLSRGFFGMSMVREKYTRNPMRSKNLHVRQGDLLCSDKKKMLPKLSHLLGFPLFLGRVIFFLSTLSGEDLPPAAALVWDKLLHVGVFTPLGFLLARAFWATTALQTLWVFVSASVVGLLFGASDEIHQLMTPGRDPGAGDVLADLIGSGLGAAIFCLAARLIYLRHGRTREPAGSRVAGWLRALFPSRRPPRT